jgi:hypothetical protein
VSFKYGEKHSTTSESTDTQTYSISEEVHYDVPPHGRVYISVLLTGDQDATAGINLEMNVSGTSQGKRIDGDFWKKTLAELPGVAVTAVGADSITYKLSSTVQAAVVSNAVIAVTPEPPDTLLARYGSVAKMVEAGVARLVPATAALARK